MSVLSARLESLARTAVLVVASDYDGTLAPIVSDPALAAPLRGALPALRRLADLPRTHVVIISGRALADLARLTGAPERIHLVGSHGAEHGPQLALALSPDARALRRRVREDLDRIAAADPRLLVEPKPAGVALHFRAADPARARAALEQVLRGPARYDGVRVRHGKQVVELAVIDASKGAALDAIRERVGATAALFVGDDITDEDAFQRLGPSDVGVKIGEGQSAAAWRLASAAEAAPLLAHLADRRAAWLAAPEPRPRN